MRPEVYWLTSRLVGAQLDQRINIRKPPTAVGLRWADERIKERIWELRRQLQPLSTTALVKRRKTWRDLVEADTYALLRRACGRWARLPDVRADGMTSFPKHIQDNAEQFLKMRHNKRFPTAAYSDEARINYLARGMAGVLSDKRAMTGIERLRNMKHDNTGPWWDSAAQRCRCWRCELEHTDATSRWFQQSYEDGLRVFMEFARTTKVPLEWRERIKAYRAASATASGVSERK
jgi:hypothetical protein